MLNTTFGVKFSPPLFDTDGLGSSPRRDAQKSGTWTTAIPLTWVCSALIYCRHYCNSPHILLYSTARTAAFLPISPADCIHSFSKAFNLPFVFGLHAFNTCKSFELHLPCSRMLNVQRVVYSPDCHANTIFCSITGRKPMWLKHFLFGNIGN